VMATRGPPKDLDNLISVKLDNVHESVTSEELMEMFQVYGPVSDVYIPRRRGTGRGYAFVRYATMELAEAALAADGKEVKGQEIKTSLAEKPKVVDRQPRRREGGSRYPDDRRDDRRYHDDRRDDRRYNDDRRDDRRYNDDRRDDRRYSDDRRDNGRHGDDRRDDRRYNDDRRDDRRYNDDRRDDRRDDRYRRSRSPRGSQSPRR